MRRLVHALVLPAVLLLFPAEGQASRLSDLAASMQPGTWAELNTGVSPEFFLTDPSFQQSVFSYGDSAGWDPFTQQWFLLGSPARRPYKFVIYSAADNSWRAGPVPFSTSDGHCYDHNTVDPTTGDVYFRQYYTRNVYRYRPRSNSWTQLPQISDSALGGFQVATALEYFPDMGGLVYVDKHGVAFWSASSNSWRKLAGSLAMGDYHNFAEYNHVHKVVIFGGGNGSSDVYKLDATGNITKMRNAPTGLGIRQSIVSVDPVSGMYLVITSNDIFYEYDVVNDRWTRISGSFPSMRRNDGALEACEAELVDHGVVMYVKYNFGSAHVWLYKHSASEPVDDTQAPTVPGNLSASAVSSTQVNLSWDPATDNLGVVGYRIYRDSSLAASAVGTSHQDNGLAPTSTHSYAVSAIDSVGNESARTAAVSVTLPEAENPDVGVDPGDGGGGGGGGGGDGSLGEENDFADRINAPGVFRWIEFDSQDEINGHLKTAYDGTYKAKIVNDVSASGGGSLRFDVPGNSPANTSGSYWVNFMDDMSRQFGEGEEFFVQWRQRFSTGMVRSFEGGNGWKQIIVGEGDQPGQDPVSSCTEMELVVQQKPRYQGPWFYHSCGRWEDMEFYDGTQIRLQHQGPPYCYYPNDPQDGCFSYEPDEWMTFQMGVKIGTWNQKDSRVRVWAARQGEPSVMIYDSDNMGGWTIYHNPGTGSGTRPGAKYGKLWLLNYNTNKSTAESHPTAYTWYDELIISSKRIPDPVGSPPEEPKEDTVAPAAPPSLTVK